MTITNNLQELVNNYNNKFAYKTLDGKTYYKPNSLSNNSHYNRKFEKGEYVEDYFTWPGERLAYGTYKIGDLTWEKLIGGQTVVMNISKNDETYWNMLNGLDFKYYSFEIRRVSNKEDWNEVKDILVENFGEDGMLEFTCWGFKPLDKNFKKDCEEHDNAICEYMKKEINACHLVD